MKSGLPEHRRGSLAPASMGLPSNLSMEALGFWAGGGLAPDLDRIERRRSPDGQRFFDVAEGSWLCRFVPDFPRCHGNFESFRVASHPSG